MIPRLILTLILVACADRVAAQTSQYQQSSSVEFLSRFAFQLSMEHLSSEEKRFVWDANWGGELDLVDYGVGRFTFVANYQTILGSELRAFDPNQGNYTLESSLSVRAHAVEIAGVFHHVSRHRSDRSKRQPVDWNMIGGRVQGTLTRGNVDFLGRADLRSVVQKSFVDYRWELDTEVGARIHLRPRVAVVAAGASRTVGVDGTRNRGTQHGFRSEGGIQLEGRAATLDLFVAAERRIDPYQLEFSTATWLTTGFRITSP